MDGLRIGHHKAEAVARSRMDLPDRRPRLRGVAAAFSRYCPEVQLHRRGGSMDSI